MGAGLSSCAFGMKGPPCTRTSACSASTQALGPASRTLRSARIPWPLPRGTECVLTRVALLRLLAMCALRPPGTAEPQLSTRDRSKDGMTVGEGTAFFWLKPGEAAISRKVTKLGLLCGYSTVTGRRDLFSQAADDICRCMERSFGEAKLDFWHSDLIFGQACGLRQVDRELQAISTLLPKSRDSLIVISIRGQMRHTFGASGSINLTAAVRALQGGCVPSTRSLEETYPAFDTLHIFKTSCSIPSRNTLINSAGFGGVHDSMVTLSLRLKSG